MAGPSNLNLIASDLRQGFCDYGHGAVPLHAFPAHFITGDVFDPTTTAPRALFTAAPGAPPPALTSLDSLTPPQGHIAAIHTPFFYLFCEGQQHTLAERLATLLAPALVQRSLASTGLSWRRATAMLTRSAVTRCSATALRRGRSCGTERSEQGYFRKPSYASASGPSTPRPLDDDELAFFQEQTQAGTRILSSWLTFWIGAGRFMGIAKPEVTPYPFR
ncbi:hypothetical protein BD779DRAFT_1466521 [Infundibulicybe gibba]|nr:hypothetical protein BD779DRAFT_1466521 [Infundibulicybe gibba]